MVGWLVKVFVFDIIFAKPKKETLLHDILKKICQYGSEPP